MGGFAYNIVRKEGGRMDLEKIGKYIAGKRKELGLTQVQLAEKLGMVNEMFIESRNDEVADKAYHRVATQADFDAW